MTKLNLFDGLYFFSTLLVISAPAILLGILEKRMKIYIAITTLLMLYLALRGNLHAIGKIGRAHV